MGTRDQRNTEGEICPEEVGQPNAPGESLDDARHRRLLTLEAYEQGAVELPGESYGQARAPRQLKARGLRETECRIDWQTGELLCSHESRPPGKQDCRLPCCRWQKVMRNRVETRLRQKRLALLQNKHGGR